MLRCAVAALRWTCTTPYNAALPPQVRFVTPVLHLNINAEGRICHGAFGSSYTSDTHMRDLLGAVWQAVVMSRYEPFDSPSRPSGSPS